MVPPAKIVARVRCEKGLDKTGAKVKASRCDGSAIGSDVIKINSADGNGRALASAAPFSSPSRCKSHRIRAISGRFWHGSKASPAELASITKYPRSVSITRMCFRKLGSSSTIKTIALCGIVGTFRSVRRNCVCAPEKLLLSCKSPPASLTAS